MVRRIAVFTFLAALAAFCVVQDRVTAAGATRYASEARAHIARDEPVTPVDEVMRPAVRRSVWLGTAAGGGVLGVGFAAAVILGRDRRG